uniref:Uncharacterized protein n=1 Tax=Acrobeloides nanus TaxID=290746 RepID=A0A914CFV4_9BILA
MEADEYVLHDWTDWGDWHGPYAIILGIMIVSFVFIVIMMLIRLLNQRHIFVERGYKLPQYNVDSKYREGIPNLNFEPRPSNPNTLFNYNI